MDVIGVGDGAVVVVAGEVVSMAGLVSMIEARGLIIFALLSGGEGLSLEGVELADLDFF